MRGRAVLAAVGGAIVLGGCLGGGASRPAATPAAASAAFASPAVISTAAYVAAASSIDLFQMRSAELALQRAQDPANRAFAERMFNAHRGTSAQLSMAGRRLNLLPSASLDPEHQAMFDALTATSDFDNTYRAQQKIVIEEALNLHGSFAASGSSPTLKPVAQNAEAVMRANLQALRAGQ